MHRVTIAVVLIAIAVSVRADDQGLKPMTAVDLLSITNQREVRLSPQGNQVLFTRSHADWGEDKTITHIWMVNGDGSDLIQMTNGADGERSPRWAPDGKRFAFLAKRGCESTQVFFQLAYGGEAHQLSDHETGVSDIAWSSDGTKIYFLADDPESEEEKEAKELTGDVFSFERDFKQQHLWSFEVESKTETRITEGDFSVLGYELSPDGQLLVYHAGPTPLYDNYDEADIRIRNLSDGTERQLCDNQVEEGDAHLSPDGTQVLFTSESNQSFETYYQANIFLVPAAGGAAQLQIPDFPYEIRDTSWSDDGKAILFSANLGVHIQIFRLDLASSKLDQLTEGEHSIWYWHHPTGSKEVVWTAHSASSPGDIWISDLSDWQPRRITSFAEEIVSKYRLPTVEVVHWQGRDGVKVEGLLYYPLDYTEGQRYPLVTHTHGGPAASVSFRLGSWAAYPTIWTAHGYAVLSPNYRGSTGYGDDFLRDMVGHYFNQAGHDVLGGVDAIIERGIADPEKLIIMGWSAGGHMTNWLVTQTDRFAVASSGAGAANWISMYGQSDVRSYRTPWFGASPWGKDAPTEVYLEHSPITYVSRATTPTLIFVGEDDARVPMPQSVEMYRGLRENGVETELIVFPEQGHSPRRLKQKLNKINREMAWFEHHLFDRTYEMEAPPEQD